MTRRALFAVLAGAALDPERLLWRPGRKLISIPTPLQVGDVAGWEPIFEVTRTYTLVLDRLVVRLGFQPRIEPVSRSPHARPPASRRA